MGASKPEEYGFYYAWGETEPKIDYSWSTYKWCNGTDHTLTKYCNNSEYGYNGYTDDKSVLDPEDDVAQVKWGGNWRMPTKVETEELLSNCTLTRYSKGNTEFNGVAGCKFTSKKEGYTDCFIFLPIAGYRKGTSYIHNNRDSYYMSSSLYSHNDVAWVVSFLQGAGNALSSRSNGFSVRPVCP